MKFFPLLFISFRHTEHFQTERSRCRNTSLPVRSTHLKWNQLLHTLQPMMFSLNVFDPSLHSSLHSSSHVGQLKRVSSSYFFTLGFFAPVSFLSLSAVILLRRAFFFFFFSLARNFCFERMQALENTTIDIRRKCSATCHRVASAWARRCRHRPRTNPSKFHQ